MKWSKENIERSFELYYNGEKLNIDSVDAQWANKKGLAQFKLITYHFSSYPGSHSPSTSINNKDQTYDRQKEKLL